MDVGDNDEKEATGEEGEQRKKANSVKQIHIDDRPSASCSTMGIELTKEDFSQVSETHFFNRGSDNVRNRDEF